MNPARELKKLASDLAAIQKTAYLFSYAELKDKESFYEAVKEELENLYGEGIKLSWPEETFSKYPELQNVPEKTKAKREELLAAIKAMPDSAFPLKEYDDSGTQNDIPSLWWESSDVWDLILDNSAYSDFNSIMDEMINWTKKQK